MLSVRPENDGGDNDCRRESSRTYLDRPNPGPGCEQFSVWAKAYAPNASVHRFIDQDTATITVSELEAPLGNVH